MAQTPCDSLPDASEVPAAARAAGAAEAFRGAGMHRAEAEAVVPL